MSGDADITRCGSTRCRAPQCATAPAMTLPTTSTVTELVIALEWAIAGLGDVAIRHPEWGADFEDFAGAIAPISAALASFVAVGAGE